MDRAIFTFVLLCSCAYVGYTSKLIVILMDGFRWDYFDHVDMPGFAKMAKDGVKVDYLQPDYPSLSYPNYYSTMTGTVIETYLIFIIHLHCLLQRLGPLRSRNVNKWTSFFSLKLSFDFLISYLCDICWKEHSLKIFIFPFCSLL